MSPKRRAALLDELARVALAERPCPILHALEVACGAHALGCTSEELEDAMRDARVSASVGHCRSSGRSP